MNLLLIDPEELDSFGNVRLSGRRAEHLRRVVGVQVGQRLKAGIVRGREVEALVIAVGDSIELAVQPQVAAGLGNTVSDTAPDMDLVVAVPRPKALPRIIQSIASFGVRRIDVINAWRVDASYFASHKLSPAALAEDARLGCEQGVQTYVPDVAVHRRFLTFMDEVLAPRLEVEPTRRLLVAHPSAPTAIEDVLAVGERFPITLVVGPDGGFTDREVASLVGAGGKVCHFGSAILRSEVAVVALLSQIELLRRLAKSPR